VVARSERARGDIDGAVPSPGPCDRPDPLTVEQGTDGEPTPDDHLVGESSPRTPVENHLKL
jgi:hypothetical protein